jgi:hypothetical protein
MKNMLQGVGYINPSATNSLYGRTEFLDLLARFSSLEPGQGKIYDDHIWTGMFQDFQYHEPVFGLSYYG